MTDQINFDYSGTYYKILREDLTHNGLTYKLGANTDPVNFNPQLYQPGGLHFTNIQNILKFFEYGTKIGIIKIPPDAQIYREENKFKADKIEIIEIKEITKDILDICKLAKDSGHKWDESVCTSAAKGGHLEVLKWARENGCPWNKDVCIYASINGHLEILKWAKENGCPWDEYVCKEAARYGRLGILKWANKNGYLCRLDIY